MGTRKFRLTLPAALLSFHVLHSLAIPLTTWTPFDLKVEDDPAHTMPISHDLFPAKYISPSVGISASVEATPTSVVGAGPGLPPSLISPPSSHPLEAISFLTRYISVSPVSHNVLIIFQLIFGATAALCLTLGLAACISRLEQHRLRQNRWISHTPRNSSLSRLELDVGEDLQILVVKTLSSAARYNQSPTKSAMSSPERRGSLGKSVRWADEMDVTCLEGEVDIATNRDLEDLLV